VIVDFDILVRDIDAFVDEIEDHETARFNAQMDADIALARKLGIREHVIRAECERVRNNWVQIKECEWQRKRSNAYRDLFRTFKNRFLAQHAFCGRCFGQGLRRIAVDLWPRVVMGGDPDRMFNPLLWESVCASHLMGGIYVPTNTE
jgi:hypothetical protein